MTDAPQDHDADRRAEEALAEQADRDAEALDRGENPAEAAPVEQTDGHIVDMSAGQAGDLEDDEPDTVLAPPAEDHDETQGEPS